MSSFWDAEDKIPVKQTKVAIQAEHGLDYVGGQKVTIHIPPTVQYFQPKESYLKFDVKLNPGMTGPMRAQLDSAAGAQILIKDIRILSGGAGAQLLEEYQDYNVLTALKYDYEVDDTIRSKRAMTEGTTQWDQTARSTKGTTKSHGSALANSPYTAPYTDDAVPDGAVWGDATSTPAGTGAENAGHKKVKCLLPLHTGIFQNSKVFPALLTDGLRIEILLERADRVIKMLESTRWTSKTQLGPIFHSCENEAGNGGTDLQPQLQMWSNNNAANIGGPVNRIFVKRDNNQIGMSNFPLVCGETFTIVKNRDYPADLADAHAVAPQFTTADGTGKLKVGSMRYIAGDGDSATTGGYWGLLEITLASPATRVDAQVDGRDWFINGDGTWTLQSTAVAASAQYTPSYTISDTELILQQLEMPAGYTRKMMSMMKGGGVLNYDFLSSTNYKYSQLKGDIVANIRLPLSQSRAKSILSVPTDSTAYSTRALMSGTTEATFGIGTSCQFPNPYNSDQYTYRLKPGKVTQGTLPGVGGTVGAVVGQVESADGACFSDRSGYTGIWDNMSNYQWFYNGQLNPNRKVDVSKTSTQQSISQQGTIELEKALAMAGIRPLSFAKYLENACIGRALSLQDGVYDTRGKDFNLQVNYEKTEAPTKNKLWCNFVHHIRRIVIRGDAISLEI